MASDQHWAPLAQLLIALAALLATSYRIIENGLRARPLRTRPHAAQAPQLVISVNELTISVNQVVVVVPPVVVD
jgi:hypothetical protein